MAYPIKEECLKYFVTKEIFHTLLKILLPVLTLFITAAIGYAIGDIKVVSDRTERIGTLERQYSMLDTSINKKLDILIKRSEK